MRAGFLFIITSEMTIELLFKNGLILLISDRSLKTNHVQIVVFRSKFLDGPRKKRSFSVTQIEEQITKS